MEYIESFWQYLGVSAPFLLMGLALAGMMHEFLPLKWVEKWLGHDGVGSIFMASLIGVPLPLCSCSVIPTAITLRKSGASNGATSSFLISAPETGVDSLSMTYAMLDLPMTLIRPSVAFLSSFFAGVLQMFFNDFSPSNQMQEVRNCCSHEGEKKSASILELPLVKGLRYGFKDLVEDMSLWLFIGFVLGALLNQFLPPGVLGQMNGPLGKLGLLVIGIPLYVCASATTPIAAVLMLKGMSPGTALILLMVGPATNIGNLAVLQKYIGRKGVILNILALSLSALIFSFLVDYLYTFFSWPLEFNVLHHEHEEMSILAHISSIILMILMIKGIIVKEVLPRLKK